MSAEPVDALSIPRVNGRHQNKSLARAPKQRAIELRMTGMTYQQVADETGYANAGSVYTIIKQAQTQHLRSVTEDYRTTELARLGALQSALWLASWTVSDTGIDLAATADGLDGSSTQFDWSVLHRILDHVPSDRWTTFGDLAPVVGTAPQPLGNQYHPGGRS